MSIATALLLVGALAIMFVMYFAGHGARGPSQGTQRADATDTSTTAPPGDASAAVEKPRRGGHGCCG
jgi:hypothetical protein